MIDRTHTLPVARQCQLLKVARSTAYYQQRPVSDTALALMRRIDELHLQYPFAGARMLRDLLRQEGQTIGRRQVATLMRRMGIEALYRKPSLSRRQSGQQIYPYLLRDRAITRPNHVWAADITYSAPRPGMLGEAYAWNAKRKEDLRSCLVPCCELSITHKSVPF